MCVVSVCAYVVRGYVVCVYMWHVCVWYNTVEYIHVCVGVQSVCAASSRSQPGYCSHGDPHTAPSEESHDMMHAGNLRHDTDVSKYPFSQHVILRGQTYLS